MANIESTIDSMELADLTNSIGETQEPSDPNMTITKIKAIVADLLNIEDLGGMFNIARKHGVYAHQVKQIEAARVAKVAALQAAEAEKVK